MCGTTTQRFVTNVCNPLLLPLHAVPALYARRWDVELAHRLLKRELNLRLLWSAKPAVIHQQIWATLIIAQILLGLWVEVAGRAEVDVFDVSLALLVRHAPLLAQAGRDPVAVLVAEGRRTGIIRPSSRHRSEVSAIPADRLTPAPPDLVLTRPARHATGQGSIPITRPRRSSIRHPSLHRLLPPAADAVITPTSHDAPSVATQDFLGFNGSCMCHEPSPRRQGAPALVERFYCIASRVHCATVFSTRPVSAH